MKTTFAPIYNLRVADSFDRYAIREKDGKELYLIIKKKIEEGNIVKLNLSGLHCITSDFLYASIGRLLSVYSKKYLNSRLKFICRDEERRKVIGLVIMNAERYYFDEEHREKLLAAYKEHDDNHADKEKKLVGIKRPAITMSKTKRKKINVNETNKTKV